MEKFKKLDRDEMKKVLGGLEGQGCSGTCGSQNPCADNCGCTYVGAAASVDSESPGSCT